MLIMPLLLLRSEQKQPAGTWQPEKKSKSHEYSYRVRIKGFEEVSRPKNPQAVELLWCAKTHFLKGAWWIRKFAASLCLGVGPFFGGFLFGEFSLLKDESIKQYLLEHNNYIRENGMGGFAYVSPSWT